MFSQEFLSEVRTLALTIARTVRNEEHLQSIEVVRGKFEAEKEELEVAEQVWDELPDVTYYCAYACLLDDNSLIPELQDIAYRYSVSLRKLEAATLAKYRLRAVQPKDIQAERAAILAAIR